MAFSHFNVTTTGNFAHTRVPISTNYSRGRVIMRGATLVIGDTIGTMPLTILRFCMVPDIASTIQVTRDCCTQCSNFITRSFGQLTMALARNFMQYRGCTHQLVYNECFGLFVVLSSFTSGVICRLRLFMTHYTFSFCTIGGDHRVIVVLLCLIRVNVNVYICSQLRHGQ